MAEKLNTPIIYLVSNLLESHSLISPHGKEDVCAKFIIGNTEDAYGLRNTMTIGSQYTLSFWLKSDVSGYVRTSGEGTFKASSEWQKCVVTFNAEDEDLILSFDTEGTYYIYHIQLELGNVATDYRPATEDVDEDIYAAQLTADKAQKKADKNAEDMAAAVLEFNEDIEGLQDQIDAHVMVWYGEEAPTTSNAPAKDWTDTDTKALHAGDMYYDTKTGYAYRWNLVSGAYAWTKIEDQDVVQALADSAKAQATADGKRRVFVSEPIPPYDEGDLWLNNKNLYSCVNPKAEGEEYEETDFEKAVRYIGAEELQTWIDGDFKDELDLIRQQIDGKAETWYQGEDPSVDWATETEKAAHAGDLWYNTKENKSYIYIYSQPDTTNPNPTEPADGQLATPYITITSYGWQESDGVPQDVYDKIDKKAQIFSTQPTVPYYEKDLWVEGDKGDIKVCKTTREEGSFSEDDWVLASKYTDDSSLETFISDTYEQEIPALKEQVDGKAETWCQTTDPADAWTDDDTKKNHLKDLWYNPETGTTTMYQYDSESATYSWVETVNVPAMFDRIDGKIQFFATQPTVPYYVNDLWVQGKEGDIYVCIEDSSDAFSADHWVKASKYTDDSKAKEVEKNLTDNYYTKTYTDAEFKKTNDAITSKVSSTTFTEYEQGMETRMSAAEDKITDEAIISTVSGTYITKNDAADTYETKKNVSTLSQKVDSIEGKVQDAEGNIAELKLTATGLEVGLGEKSQTWNQTTDPSVTWTDEATRRLHVGDLWLNPNTKESYIYTAIESSPKTSTPADGQLATPYIVLYSWEPTFEIPQEVFEDIDSAAKSATDYLSFSDDGLVIGDMTGDTLGSNVQIHSGGVNIRDNDKNLASFEADEIWLGNESEYATIHFAKDVGMITGKQGEHGSDLMKIEAKDLEIDTQWFLIDSNPEEGGSESSLYVSSGGGDDGVGARVYHNNTGRTASIDIGLNMNMGLEGGGYVDGIHLYVSNGSGLSKEILLDCYGLKYNNEAVSLVRFDKGYVSASSVPANGYKDIAVTFNKGFSSTPRINLTLASSSDAGAIGSITPAILANSESAAGFTIRVFNAGSISRSPGVYWTAMEELT